MTDASTKGPKLYWLEFGRGVAAIGVLLTHIHEYLLPTPTFLYPFGEWGVAFFFVLSGFVIHHVHARDIGVPSRALIFAWRRFVRIFPTYWVVLASVLILRQHLGNPAHSTDVSLPFLVQNFLLLPGGKLYIGVAWTLRHELFFYGMYMIAMLSFRLTFVVGVTWLLIVLSSLLSNGFEYRFDGPIEYLFASYLNLFFFVGLIIAELYRRGKAWLAASVLLSISVGSIMICYIYPNSELASLLVQISICGALVSGGVWLSSFGFGAPLFAKLLGQISYPLYLIHIPMMLIAHSALIRLGFKDDYFYLTIATGVTLAFVAAYGLSLIEKPTIARLQQMFRTPIVAAQ